MAKPNTFATSRIFEAVYETALDLHALGVIDKHKLHEYEVLCEKSAPKTIPGIQNVPGIQNIPGVQSEAL